MSGARSSKHSAAKTPDATGDAVLWTLDESAERRLAANEIHYRKRKCVNDLATALPPPIQAEAAAFEALLDEAVRTHTLTLHIEEETRAADDIVLRLRHRRLDGLAEQRHDGTDPHWQRLTALLDWLCDADIEAGVASVARLRLRVQGRRIALNASRWGTPDHRVWSLQLCPHNDISLAQRFLNNDALANLRELLGLPNGLVLIACRDRWHGEQLMLTLARELAASDKRLLHITRGDNTGEPLMQTISAASVHGMTAALQATTDADIDIVLNAIPGLRQGEQELLATRCLQSLVVQVVLATNPSDALAAARTLGWTPNALDAVLRGVVVEHRVVTLCPECRHPALPSDDEISWLSEHLEPIQADRMQHWFLQRQALNWFAADGCSHCQSTGAAALRSLAEVVSATPTGASARHVVNTPSAEATVSALQDRTAFTRALLAHCSAGDIGLDTAQRLLRAITER